MYSAESTKTVPRDFDIVVVPVSGSWDEGLGLDLENYRDLTMDGTGSNWMNATGDVQGSSATVTAASKTAIQRTGVSFINWSRRRVIRHGNTSSQRKWVPIC